MSWDKWLSCHSAPAEHHAFMVSTLICSNVNRRFNFFLIIQIKMWEVVHSNHKHGAFVPSIVLRELKKQWPCGNSSSS